MNFHNGYFADLNKTLMKIQNSQETHPRNSGFYLKLYQWALILAALLTLMGSARFFNRTPDLAEKLYWPAFYFGKYAETHHFFQTHLGWSIYFCYLLIFLWFFVFCLAILCVLFRSSRAFKLSLGFCAILWFVLWWRSNREQDRLFWEKFQILNKKAYPTTNLVYLTPHLKFFLHGQKDYHPQSEFKCDDMISFTLAQEPESRSLNPTNAVFYRSLPFKQAIDFKLFDERGREVPKTRLGLENSQLPNLPKTKHEMYRFKRVPIVYEPRELFRPEEMFVITNKGLYDLEVRLRICAPMTNGVLDPGAMLDSRKFNASQEFGIIISDPVRVKVIKKG